MDCATLLNWRVDLHVHTRRYSPCAESLDPDALPEMIIHSGLHGVVITEHDHIWSADEIAALNHQIPGHRIYRGVEVSSRNGHFLVIGLDDLGNLRPGISAERVVLEAKRQGAAVVWAHPHLTYRQMKRPLRICDMPDGVDALEIVSTVTDPQQTETLRGYALQMGYGTVGGSDAHALGQVGKAYTLFAELPANEKALAAAIHNGLCDASVPPSRTP